MTPLLLADTNMMWYAPPLIAAISLVYAATHHERLTPILIHAVRLALMIAGFMLLIMVVLALISWQL
jgi:hypothetical protein